MTRGDGEPSPRRVLISGQRSRSGSHSLQGGSSKNQITRRHRDEALSLQETALAQAKGLIFLTSDVNLLAVWKEAGLAAAAALPRRPSSLSAKARQAARRLNLPAVAVPDSLFLDPQDHQVYRVLRAIGLNSSLSRLKPQDLAPEDAWLASAQEYEARFRAWTEAINATHALAERLAWRRNRGTGPTGLFIAGRKVAPPKLPPDKEMDHLRRQFAVLGFLTDCHPIVLFADALNGHGLVKAADLSRHVGRRVRLAGWLITGKTVRTKAGDPMQFLTFEDKAGLVETTFFPEAYRRFWLTLDRNRPYILAGKV